MDGRVIEIFATKGIEYLLILGFLGSLVLFWKALGRPAPASARQPTATGSRGHWFSVPDGFQFHPGHAWIRPDADGLLRVGMDDFAQKLVGEAEDLRLPEPGTRLEQGTAGWSLSSRGRSVDMLAPVSGEVVAVNEEALGRPSLVNRSPYEAGWLFRVRAPRWLAERHHLLSGRLAHTWMEESTNALRRMMAPELGLALQDGGVPVDGIARHLDPEHWDDLARSLLLTAGDHETDATEPNQPDSPADDAEPER